MKKNGGMLKDWRKYCAEFLGTMILSIVGLGAVILPIALMGTTSSVDFLGAFGVIFAPFAFGFTLMAVIYIIGPISGGHVNPAVSFGFALRRKLSWKDCIMYIICQFIGAIVGILILFGTYKLLTGGAVFNFGETYADKGTRYVSGLFGIMIIEIVMTFIFVLAWMGIVRKVENKAVAAFAIGLIFTALIFASATLNPALNLGTAIFSGKAALKDVWLFLVAPLIGGALAALIGCALFRKEDREEVGTKAAPKIADVSPVQSKQTNSK